MTEKELLDRLKRAVSRGDVTTARRLIKGGVDMNALLAAGLGNVGGTLLHDAVSGSNMDMVQVLLKAKCNVNIKDKAGHAPLHLACRRGKFDAVKILLENKAQVNSLTKDRRSPLHITIWWGHDEISRHLLSAGASVNQQDDDGWSCLHSACSRLITASLIEDIIKRGARINIQDKLGYTPLHLCLQNNCLDVATLKLLLYNGADPNLKTKKSTTLDILLKNPAPSPDVLKVLLQGGYLTHLETSTHHNGTLRKTLHKIQNETMQTLLTASLESIPGLSHLCRCRLRAILNDVHGGRAIWQYVQRLPVPQLVKEYIVFAEELDVT